MTISFITVIATNRVNDEMRYFVRFGRGCFHWLSLYQLNLLTQVRDLKIGEPTIHYRNMQLVGVSGSKGGADGKTPYMYNVNQLLYGRSGKPPTTATLTGFGNAGAVATHGGPAIGLMANNSAVSGMHGPNAPNLNGSNNNNEDNNTINLDLLSVIDQYLDGISGQNNNNVDGSANLDDEDYYGDLEVDDCDNEDHLPIFED